MSTDLVTVIAERSMNAAVRLAESHGILNTINAQTVCDALKVEIKAGYDEAARDAKQALEVMGEPMANATLNASCILFAARALRAAGYIVPEPAAS